MANSQRNRETARDPVLSVGERRRAILNQIGPIERAYAEMHPEDPSEAETDARLQTLYQQLERIEAEIAALTATSIAGLIEQMHVLAEHVRIEAPDGEPLARAVIDGLRRLKRNIH